VVRCSAVQCTAVTTGKKRFARAPRAESQLGLPDLHLVHEEPQTNFMMHSVELHTSLPANAVITWPTTIPVIYTRSGKSGKVSTSCTAENPHPCHSKSTRCGSVIHSFVTFAAASNVLKNERENVRLCWVLNGARAVMNWPRGS